MSINLRSNMLTGSLPHNLLSLPIEVIQASPVHGPCDPHSFWLYRCIVEQFWVLGSVMSWCVVSRKHTVASHA